MELDYSEIGKRIARRRKELGLKQVEVCERAGINDKYLTAIERIVYSLPGGHCAVECGAGYYSGFIFVRKHPFRRGRLAGCC